MAKRVMITGCSSGVGRALAQVLTSRGYEVIATARNLDALSGLEVAQRLELDVTSDDSVERAVAAAGRVDVLVNNAGVGLWGPFEAVDMADAKRVFETNVFGPMRVLKAVLPQMRERGDGLIVQVSSVTGRSAGALLGHYSATKHALNAYSESLSVEAASYGIKVAIVELGAVDSDFGRNRLIVSHPAYEELVETVKARIFGSRVGAPSSEVTAEGIADVIDAGGPDLFVQLDDTVRRMLQARFDKMAEQWESAQQKNLGTNKAKVR